MLLGGALGPQEPLPVLHLRGDDARRRRRGLDDHRRRQGPVPDGQPAEAADAVVVADAASGQIVLWNPAAEKMFGYSPAEAAGLSVEVLVPAHLKPQHRAGLANYFATGHGTIVDAGAVVEVSAVCKSGEELTVDYRFSNKVEPVACKCGSKACRGTINLKE